MNESTEEFSLTGVRMGEWRKELRISGLAPVMRSLRIQIVSYMFCRQ